MLADEREGALEHLEVDLDLDADLPELTGFPYKLEQIFANLISNAVWATRPAGTMTIRTAVAPPGGEGDRERVFITFTDDHAS